MNILGSLISYNQCIGQWHFVRAGVPYLVYHKHSTLVLHRIRQRTNAISKG
jgi:hypothetical protein